MELQEALRKRRSIRKFTGEPVSDGEIRSVLEAAGMAPSWANVQPWEFIVLRDRSLMERMTATYIDGNPATKCSLAASALIVACAITGVSGCYDGKNLTRFNEWFMFDLGMAVQNLCLKAHELGIGSVVAGLLDHDRAKELLGLPADREVVACIPLGRPAVAGKEGPPRKPLSQFAFLDAYGNPFPE
ncbi:MAG TPA: nitroreductase family protein [Spirochaetota bacterium]|nr:nitroreductase family protein [Spirochaetota bacterium]OPZ38782.1 MAG: Albonoursin synthase [Spirochaetes bacterium ADurb.BinA120]HNU91957.1 nitroreductase family protein [Spirochaetota bacterium]HPI14543.1 nitroreductase family protein [Spirochaetota bacterium]HPO46115.1 nitroreductase family protein [Spirochaetota bacterium]